MARDDERRDGSAVGHFLGGGAPEIDLVNNSRSKLSFLHFFPLCSTSTSTFSSSRFFSSPTFPSHHLFTILSPPPPSIENTK
jgi:hypothetical protein